MSSRKWTSPLRPTSITTAGATRPLFTLRDRRLRDGRRIQYHHVEVAATGLPRTHRGLRPLLVDKLDQCAVGERVGAPERAVRRQKCVQLTVPRMLNPMQVGQLNKLEDHLIDGLLYQHRYSIKPAGLVELGCPELSKLRNGI